jgi:hypothetical protein
VSRPTSERAAALVGHGVGATPPRALAGDDLRHAWLDATMSITLLAPAGAAFDDESAVRAWARRAWQDLAVPGDAVAAPESVAWRAGRRRTATVGVTWPGDELAALPATLHSLAPLWAGVLARALQALPGDGPWRLVVAEGRALTLIDVEGGVPCRWATLALARDEAAGLAQALEHAPGPVWAAGHSLAGELPSRVRAVPGLGPPSQASAALLHLLQSVEAAEPALRRAPPFSRRVGAALLATAGVVLALAAQAAWSAHDAWRGAQARAEARERLAEARGRQLQRAAALHATARQRLQQPWGLRWTVAEAAQPTGGGWLRLEQRRDSPTLLLVGEADTPSEALAVARRIAVVRGVSEAVLLRSDAAAAPAAGGRARFEIGVRLAEAQP